ncbi:H(+)/Cl(-) exchange transporter ClcA [Hartmannibacter diazotrophicus]|uniref:H(+)/Cl(-) exchange transporter ClcA n=1 Tax=Hartmannibacter diazotrophicus TaxID=1482074 RepID=A0A2C9D9G4_9HYPH|nr:chloride channel protein [Hartmannibacter diazotrophicus]SON56952.1 H(+)/Cl(-) exchange transporter ClcA [Hartmannibacter diazotrophicus]
MTTSPESLPSAVAPAAEPQEREFSLPVLTFLAFIVGCVAALGAIIFKFLIAFISNLTNYGIFSFELNPNAYGPESPWGPFVILVPILGGLVVVFLVRTFAPEAKGHGVPEVMYAIYHNDGNVRGIVAVVKSLASALSIGTGASVGREGPIIQIGSSFGSTFARYLGMTRSQKITLLAAGAGAGIAATFNTPLGGVLFAVEVLLPEVSTRTFLPVVAATATSTYISRLVLGVESAFVVPVAALPQIETVNIPELVVAAAVGAAMGVAAWAFVRVLEFCEDYFEEMPINPYLQNVIGMGIVGLMGYGFLQWTGHYEVMSVGYATIQSVLNGDKTVFFVLMALFFGKLLATSISLGAGASGGIFSPSLFMGATLGGAVGVLGMMVFPNANLDVPTFAVIGMGAMVGGATSAAMTAIVMIFEMTRDYGIIVPLVLAVALAVGVRRALVSSDIYTIKLRNRGKPIPTDRSTNMFLVQPAREAMSTAFTVFPDDMSVQEMLKSLPAEGRQHVVVSEGGRIAGFIRIGRIPYQPDRFAGQTLADIVTRDFVLAADSSTLNTVMTRMSKRQRTFAVIIKEGPGVPRPEDIVGVIDEPEIAGALVRNHYG